MHIRHRRIELRLSVTGELALSVGPTSGCQRHTCIEGVRRYYRVADAEPIRIRVLLCGFEGVRSRARREIKPDIRWRGPHVPPSLPAEPEHAIRRSGHSEVSGQSLASQVAENGSITGCRDKTCRWKIAVLWKGKGLACRVVSRILRPIPAKPLPRTRRLLCAMRSQTEQEKGEEGFHGHAVMESLFVVRVPA